MDKNISPPAKFMLIYQHNMIKCLILLLMINNY